MSITATDAAQKAREYYKTISGDNAEAIVEEIFLNEDSERWFITLSTLDTTSSMVFDNKRKYKEFIISSTDGEVISMSIKKP